MVDEDSIDAAAREIARQEAALSDEVTLSNGVRLKCRAVPPLTLNWVASRSALEPQPPTYHNPDKGRDEPNFQDPDYLRAIAEHREEVERRNIDMFLGLGTRLVHPHPDGVQGPDEADWADEIAAFIGVEIAAQGTRQRYVQWLRHYALTSVADLNATVLAVTRLSGVREEDVAQAMESFRGGEGRGADPDRDAAQDGGLSDSLPAGAGGAGADAGADGRGEIPQPVVVELAGDAVQTEG